MNSIGHLYSEVVLDGVPTTPPPPFCRFILFELGGSPLCVHASAVSEVVPPVSVTQLPDCPQWLLGLAAHRGEIIAVIDPKTIIGALPPAPAGAKAKLIIFRPQPDGSQFALPVDTIRELFAGDPVIADARFPRSSLQTEVIRDGEPIKLLDHQAMFASFYEDRPTE